MHSIFKYKVNTENDWKGGVILQHREAGDFSVRNMNSIKMGFW